MPDSLQTSFVNYSEKAPNQTLVVPRKARDDGIGVTPLETRQCYPVRALA